MGLPPHRIELSVGVFGSFVAGWKYYVRDEKDKKLHHISRDGKSKRNQAGPQSTSDLI